MAAAGMDQPVAGRFDGATHLFPVRVYFEDTDLSGVVYHANYLRYCERARSDMLRLAGVDQRAHWQEAGTAYAVTQATLDYRAPARLDDALLVASRVEAATPARVVIHQAVSREALVLVSARVTVALVGPDGRPRRQPEPWLARYRQLVQGGDRTP